MGQRTEDQHKAYSSHLKYYQAQRQEGPDLMLIENVCEYTMQRVEKEMGAAYKCCDLRLDPRLLGFPTARARRFIICYKVSKFEWSAEISFQSVIEALRRQPVMDIQKYFWMKKESERHNLGQWYAALPEVVPDS